MWLRLDDQQIAKLTSLVDADFDSPAHDGAERARLDTIKRILATKPDPDTQAFINAVETSDDLEVDEDAAISRGEEGAFVMSWSWVSNEDAGIKEKEEEN
ncbi:hypothetical protein ACCS91_33710 [Rhizobium ruizarguesonis]